jgi:hypothetical protein
MLIRPWLLYYRRRLFTAAIVSVLAACLAHLWVSGDGFFDFGIFWHSYCGCPVDAADAYFVLNLPPIVALIAGLVFGFLSPGTAVAPSGSGVPGNQFKALSRFFLTRPVPRLKIFLLPQAVAMITIAVFPAVAFLLLVGWLRFVHAPSLSHLMATIRIIPAASALGPHPTFVQVLDSLSAVRRYLAATSVGFFAYAILSSQQWLVLSPNRKLNLLGIFPVLLLFAPVLLIVGRYNASDVFLAPGHGASLSYMPSVFAISLHFGIAVAIAFGCWRILRSVEL